MKINNRRYIGSKTQLLEQIYAAVESNIDGDYTFVDIFGGTGVVASYFADKGKRVIVNDLLYSNFVCYQCWLSNEQYDIDCITKIVGSWNSLNPSKIPENYFSKYFGNKYYHINDAKVIGYAREYLESVKSEINEREYYILLTSILYEADKIANTCGHFESFLKHPPVEKGVKFQIPEIALNKEKANIYCKDANELVKELRGDVYYLDPPYNARQYVNFYHVLENLARWEKPTEFEGNSAKFKRNHLKSEYCKAKAKDVFEDLINNIDGRLIIVSYSNTYNAKSSSSNNRLSEDDLNNILGKKGETYRIEIDYKAFNSGKTNLSNHKEYLYVCKLCEK